MEANSGASEPNSNATITINVKFSGVSIPISISPNSTIKDLKSLLLPSTNVLPRGQKLIFKGKVLEDPMTLTASKLTNGSKLMLVASQCLYQGVATLKDDGCPKVWVVTSDHCHQQAAHGAVCFLPIK